MKLPVSRIVASIVALAALVGVAASPQLLGPKVNEALASLAGADPRLLGIAAAAVVCSFLSSASAWRAALAAAGGRISLPQAAARIGIGSLVNTLAPAKLGDAVKVALCSKVIDGPDRLWTAGGVYAGLGAAHALAVAALVVVASATGAAPLWPVFALCGAVAAIGGVALSSTRWRRHHRIAHLLGGFASLARSPRTAAVVMAWTAAASLAKLCAAGAAAAALGLPSPFLTALVIVLAMDLSSTIPVTPGNVGVGSGAAALALQSRGIAVGDAIGVGLTLQALHTAVSVVAGTAGGLYLAQPNGTARRWTARGAVALGLSVTLATAVSAVVLDWT
jgi:uncharacterized membrane protein YbhN (UPF0104 family)